MRFDFLVETFETERLKTLSVWSQFKERDLGYRPSRLGRTVRDQMVHQCLSEHAWFTRMLGIAIEGPELPEQEKRLPLIEHYAEASARRVSALAAKDETWYDESTTFFAVARSRAWVIVRRIAHTAHHRGQLTTYLRYLGEALYSTYGPTADTGGLPASGASVLYRYPSVDALLVAERTGGVRPPLPGPGSASPTERP